VLAALAAYHNSLSGPFILDDLVNIAGNPAVRHLWPFGPGGAPQEGAGGGVALGGRQVVLLSFAINYALGGLATRGYHIVSLVVHMAAGLTLFGIVRRTFHSGTMPALAVAVLWTVHPLNTETVAYMTERVELLMGLFYLLTIYCFIRHAENAEAGCRGRASGWGLLSIGACLLGMASKEVMVTAPLVVFVYDRTFVSGTFRAAWRRHTWLHAGLFGTWLFMAYQLQNLGRNGGGFGTGVSWWAYALTEIGAVVHYLRLAFWPQPLVMEFGLTVLPSGFLTIAAPAAVLVVLLAVTVVAMWRRPALGFAGFWFFVILAPTSSVVPIGGTPVAEHRMYLPLVAVITLVVLVLHSWLGRRSLLVFLAVAAGLGWRTVRRNDDYRSAVAFFGDTVRRRPENYFARFNLGKALAEAGSYPEAIAQFQEAIRLAPDEALLRLGLGDVLSGQGRFQEAAEQYEIALRLDPNSADAHTGIANDLFKAGRPGEALDEYRAALRINPAGGAVWYNLGVALSSLRRFGEAIGAFQQAVRLGVDSAEAHNNLGTALAEVGRLPEAVGEFREALRLDPDSAGARANLEAATRMLAR
jgi:Flp pilus assembly protein TadD